MSTVTGTTPSFPTGGFPKFRDGAEWLRELGDVPLERVVFDPWPGTATEEDLVRIVETGDKLCELIDGTLVEKTVGVREAWIAGLIVTVLNSFVRPRKLGVVLGADAMLKMQNNRVRLPHASFISKDRWHSLPSPLPAIAQIGPDLVVEVLSPGNTKREIDQKLKECFASGSRLAWIVDPRKKSVAVHVTADAPEQVLGEADTLDGGDVLPGFTLEIKELFEPPL
jgi:Uma2 family endonuclease